jgi:hypothetical protein
MEAKKSARNLACVLTLLALAAPAHSQGSNDCSSAQPISGFGIFPFDDTTATTDGLATGCTANPTKDVWFLWTSVTAGFVTIRTCGFTSLDTMLTVYVPGSCPPNVPLVCADDFCDVQTQLSFQSAGNTDYLVRVGVFPGTPGGTGSIEIEAGNGGCGDPSIGPDVIVGELYDIIKWGTLGGVTSYSLGTYSCNVGDQPVHWFSEDNRHPVIGQNIYRLEEGRFEQVGMSWLKHGFYALTDNLCCTCNDPHTGSLLGVGCSDPYSAGLNGSQARLGPRSEVNPWTGVFPYPFTTQGQTGDVLYKRLQIANSEIDPALHPTAQFFGEGQYVTEDDATAGNQMNNASWRPLTVGNFTSGGWDLLLSSYTRRTDPAIRAWVAMDPNVQIHPVQASGDGALYVASNVTDNGNGTWHYEYAIENLNSDRAGQKFSVPIAPGVVVSNVSFHDISYHSGERYSSQDWTSQVFADHVEWASDTYVNNANANALRWGTLYNFRFDADGAPGSDAGTLTFFKPGVPDSLGVLVRAPSQGCAILSYCLTSPNSVGPGAIMSAAGSTSISSNDLTLYSTGCPTNQFGMFYYGPSPSQTPFGNGYKCVGGSLIRFHIQQVDQTGTASLSVDYTDLPNGDQINVGETDYFQFWYRDPMGGNAFFNLSDALSISFCP